MAKVSAVRCEDYAGDQVEAAIDLAIERIGFEIPWGKKVLIKPNIMSQNRPEQHTITHYSIVDAICHLLHQRNNEIIIGESIAFYQKGLTEKAFAVSGIKKVAQKYGAKLVAFEGEKLLVVERRKNHLAGFDVLYLPEVCLHVDLIIDACKLKSHSAMRFSGGIKNMFGCLPGGYKQKIHQWTKDEYELADVFIDICQATQPILVIMDGVMGLDGGPSAIGKPVPVGTILASVNPAALDMVASAMIGYNPEKIPMLVQAVRRGMMNDFTDIEVVGEIRKIPFKRRVDADMNRASNPDSLFVKHTYVRLKILEERCTRCGQCAESCPVKAINMSDKTAFIDQERCINCYSCMYFCNYYAIHIAPSLMNRFIWGLRRIMRL